MMEYWLMISLMMRDSKLLSYTNLLWIFYTSYKSNWICWFALIAFPFSSNIKIINYRHIIYAILFQLVLAFILIKIPVITNLFSYLADGVAALQVATERLQNFIWLSWWWRFAI